MPQSQNQIEESIYPKSVGQNAGFRTYFQKNRTGFLIGTLIAVIVLLSVAIIFLAKYQTVRVDLNIISEEKSLQEENQTEITSTPRISTPFPQRGENVTSTQRPATLKIVSRREWKAQQRQQQFLPLQVPVPYVIIGRTKTKECLSRADCITEVRAIQESHIQNNNWDIPYNFLVGGDGSVYEGRGWKAQGQYTNEFYNNVSVSIAFIWPFFKLKPPLQQIIACKQFIEEGRKMNYIKKNYTLLTVKESNNVITAFDEEIKTWDYWFGTT